MADVPNVEKHEPLARYTDPVSRYLLIYLCILVLAGLQFVIGYSHLDTSAKFARMLLIAIAEAGLALLFFMHLWAEKRGFLFFVVVLPASYWLQCNSVGLIVIVWNGAPHIRSLNPG